MEHQTEEHEELDWELGDVGIRSACVAKVSYVTFGKSFIISGFVSLRINELQLYMFVSMKQ